MTGAKSYWCPIWGVYFIIQTFLFSVQAGVHDLDGMGYTAGTGVADPLLNVQWQSKSLSSNDYRNDYRVDDYWSENFDGNKNCEQEKKIIKLKVGAYTVYTVYRYM